MKISQQGLEFIKASEGCVLNPYLDTQGIKTIGIGHVISNTEIPAIIGPISETHALELLVDDLHTVEFTLNHSVTARLTQYQYDALCDFVFNIGSGAFKSSTMLRCLNTGQLEQSANQFLVWTKQPELKPRRERERTLFLTGIY